MKRLLAPIAAALLLSGASCEQRPDPPSAVEVRVPVPIACRVPEPQCEVPAYDSAQKAQPGDTKVQLLRAESAAQADCLRQFRLALAACRAAGAP